MAISNLIAGPLWHPRRTEFARRPIGSARGLSERTPIHVLDRLIREYQSEAEK
jgi:hypothetical protein